MNSDIIVVDEIEKGMSEDQVNPPMEDAIPVEVEDATKSLEIEVTEEDEMDDSEDPADAAEDAAEDKMDDETMKAVAPAAVSEEDVNATTKMIEGIRAYPETAGKP